MATKQRKPKATRQRKPKATRRRKPKTPTLGSVGVVKIGLHELTDIPLMEASERWHFADWDGAYRAIQHGKAITIPCKPHEVDTVLVHARARFAEEEVTQPLDHRYELDTKRLWIWGGCSIERFVERVAGVPRLAWNGK